MPVKRQVVGEGDSVAIEVQVAARLTSFDHLLKRQAVEFLRREGFQAAAQATFFGVTHRIRQYHF